MQVDMLEKAVEGTPIQGLLKTVRSEAELVLKTVEGSQPEVEGCLSESISKSTDSTAAAAQQVGEAAQQAQSTAQMAAQTGQEAINKLNSAAPSRVVDFATNATSQAAYATQMDAQTAQPIAQELINMFNSVAPAPVVDLANATTAQVSAISNDMYNFQKMAMGSSRTPSSIVDNNIGVAASLAVNGKESESDTLLWEEMAIYIRISRSKRLEKKALGLKNSNEKKNREFEPHSNRPIWRIE